jgi:hypothetical protein
MGVSEAIGRLVWEVWRLTHEAAGSFPPPFEALSANVRAWWCDAAVPMLLAASDAVGTPGAGAAAHRAIMDDGLPEGAPFTVADVQPWVLLPAPTRAAWDAMVSVAAATRAVSPRTTLVVPA